jgi:adenylate cyclase class IV
MFIDLDSASFGYNIGEIEIMVDSEDDIAQAETKIESLAKRLGKQVRGVYSHIYLSMMGDLECGGSFSHALQLPECLYYSI